MFDLIRHAGSMPGIHVLQQRTFKNVDGRDVPGHGDDRLTTKRGGFQPDWKPPANRIDRASTESERASVGQARPTKPNAASGDFGSGAVALYQVVPDEPSLSDGSGLLHNGKGATSGAGLGATGGIMVRAGLDFLALRLTVFFAAFLAAFLAFFFTAFFGAERLAAAFFAGFRPAALAFFFFGAFFAAFLAVFFAAFFTDLAAFFLELLVFDLSAFLALAIVVLLLPT